MTDISVTKTAYQVENRAFAVADPGVWTRKSITLDVSTFTANTHYPNGFIPAGVALGKITATGLYGPYDDTATDGRQTAAGFLWDAIKIPNLLDLTKDVGAPLWQFGFIKESKLPLPIDANGKADLAAWFKFE